MNPERIASIPEWILGIPRHRRTLVFSTWNVIPMNASMDEFICPNYVEVGGKSLLYKPQPRFRTGVIKRSKVRLIKWEISQRGGSTQSNRSAWGNLFTFCLPKDSRRRFKLVRVCTVCLISINDSCVKKSRKRESSRGLLLLLILIQPSMNDESRLEERGGETLALAPYRHGQWSPAANGLWIDILRFGDFLVIQSRLRETHTHTKKGGDGY